MARLSKANGLLKNSEGWVEGTLISVEPVESELTNQKTGEIEQTSQIEWVWEVATKKEKVTTKLHTWSGLTLNTSKHWYDDGKDGESQFNKLTQLVLASNLASLEEIEQAEAGGDIDLDTEAVIGKKYKFKTRPKRGRGSLEEVVISTVELIED